MQAQTAVFGYFLLVFPVIFLLTSVAHLYIFSHQRSDIWWTPRGTQVPLAESHDRVAIYVRGNELDDLVAAGRLRLNTESGASVVTRKDIGLRFNNWDRVRADRIPLVLTYATTAGAAAALLLVGLILTLVRRPLGTGPPPAGSGV